jgi:HEAT repeat protein
MICCLAGCGRAPGPLLAHGKSVEHWLGELKKPDAAGRKKAVAALGLVGGADPAAVPALIGALKDRDATVRDAAVLALFNLGPDARDAAPALQEVAQRDASPTVRAHAAKALAQLGASPH